MQTVAVSLTDPYQSGAANASPVQKVSTTNEYKGAGAGTGSNCASAPNSTRWINCLTIASGNTPFTNATAASAAGAKIYSSTDADWTNEQSGFLGNGAVTFTLNAGAGVLVSGSSSGLTFPSSGLSGTINSLSNGLHIQYTYTYDESPIGTP
jgi:hypothetical protein